MPLKSRLKFEYSVFPIGIIVILFAYALESNHHKSAVQLYLHDQRVSLSADAEEARRTILTSLKHLNGVAELLPLWPKQQRLSKLTDTFKVMAYTSAEFSQLRFIDHSGQERVRVNRNSQGRVWISPQAALQNKGNRYYVQEGLEQPVNSFYLSRFDLNVERGKVETPWHPTFRTTLHVHTEDGGMDGVLVLNVNGGPIIEQLSSDPVSPSYLINSRGDWLKGPVASQDWGFMFGKSFNIAKHPDAPIQPDSLFANNQAPLPGQAGGLWLASRIDFATINNPNVRTSESWVVLHHISHKTLMALGTRGYFLEATTTATTLLSLLLFALLRRLRRTQENRQIARIRLQTQEEALSQLESSIQLRTQELREALQFIRTVTDNLPMVIGLWDQNYRCQFINETAFTWLGLKSEQARGMPLRDMLGEAFFNERKHIYDQVLGGRPLEVEMQFTRHSDQKERLLNLSYYPCRLQNNRSGFISIASDITDQRRITNELKQRTLEAEQAAQAKAAFLANMSHEIRTPMNAILGMLTLLRDTKLDSQQQSFAEKAHLASNALLHLLNDILDLSKLDAGKVNLEHYEFSLEELIKRSADLFTIAAEQKGLAFHIAVTPDTPLSLIGDPLRIGQVLTNLLGNAIKFTETGTVRLSISCCYQSSTQATLSFSVIDTGIGMSEEQQKNIFKIFNQADTSTTRRFGGTGLGLSICLHLAQLMGGELTVESKPEQGSTFTLTVTFELSSDYSRYLDFTPCGTDVLLIGESSELATFVSTYAESWDLSIHYLPPLSTANEISCQLIETQSEQKVLLLDSTALDTSVFADAVLEWMKEGQNDKQANVLILVPARGPSPLITTLEAAGAQLIPAPLTPYRLYDALISATASGNRAITSPRGFHEQETLSDLTVLIVDDLELNLEVAEQLLKRIGISSDVAASGAQALEAIQKCDYDVVLMDIHMEEISGLDTTRSIRSMAPKNSTPFIIALSASAMEEDKRSALEAGVDAYLTKPLLLDELSALLQERFRDRSPHERPSSNSEESRPPWSSRLPSMIDAAQAYQQMAGDEKLFAACLRSFKASMEDLPDALQGAIDTDDVAKGTHFAHRLKGAAANIANGALQKQAAKLETELRESGTWHQAETTLNMLRNHLSEIKHWSAGRHEHVTEQKLSTEELNQLLQNIANLIARHRLVPTAKLSALHQALSDRNLVESAESLVRSIDRFDYTVAQELTNKLLEELS